jgi:adenylylsulfate kinase
VVAIVPFISPFRAVRDEVRAAHQAAGVPFAEVFVSTSLPVSESRDVKGLYAQARRGELTGLTGVDDPYEPPTAAELEIDTDAVALPEAVEATTKLIERLIERLRP